MVSLPTPGLPPYEIRRKQISSVLQPSNNEICLTQNEMDNDKKQRILRIGYCEYPYMDTPCCSLSLSKKVPESLCRDSVWHKGIGKRL